MLMSLLLFQPWLIVHVVCLYIQVIILCCNGSISAVSLLHIHELYGFFVTFFYTMLHVMVLTGFETVTHFVKKSKAWIFLQHA